MSVRSIFFPLAKKKKTKKEKEITATLGKVIGLPLLFHKLGPVMWKKIVDDYRMICGKWRQKRERKMGRRKKKIWVDVTGSKSHNSAFLDGIYQAGAEGVMVFLFSWHEGRMSSPPTNQWDSIVSLLAGADEKTSPWIICYSPFLTQLQR